MQSLKKLPTKSRNALVKERTYQAKLVMALFQLWQLTAKQQAILLGLSPRTGTSIYKYKSGHPLPAYRDIQDRISHLLAIHKLLRRAYSGNIELAYRWICTPNADFDYKTPFEIIETEGHIGLFHIRNYLEKATQL